MSETQSDSWGSITRNLAALKRGDQVAVKEIWDRYFVKLTAVARRKLGTASSRELDAEDVASRALYRFYGGATAGRFAELTSRDDLWPLLLTITWQESVDEIRRATRQKRGGGAVRGESMFDGGDGNGNGLAQIPDSGPTPDFAAMLDERLKELLDRLSDDSMRQVALGKMEGCSNQELAESIGISIHSVGRKLRAIRELWERELTSEFGGSDSEQGPDATTA